MSNLVAGCARRRANEYFGVPISVADAAVLYRSHAAIVAIA
jgi:hypothetical protein